MQQTLPRWIHKLQINYPLNKKINEVPTSSPWVCKQPQTHLLSIHFTLSPLFSGQCI